MMPLLPAAVTVWHIDGSLIRRSLYEHADGGSSSKHASTTGDSNHGGSDERTMRRTTTPQTPA